MINIIGNHPNYHVGFDAPLTSDIDTLAKNFSCWIKSCSTPKTLAQDGADAYTASLRQSAGTTGQIATLIMGADAAWGDSHGPVSPNPEPVRAAVNETAVIEVANILSKGRKTALLLENQGAEQAAWRLPAVSRAKPDAAC